jgi:hypothetical protein
MNTYHIEYKNRALDVEVEMGPAEPDVGSFGNGRVAISVEGIRDAAGDCVLGDYSPLEIEDIAHEVYAILGEHQ